MSNYITNWFIRDEWCRDANEHTKRRVDLGQDIVRLPPKVSVFTYRFERSLIIASF